MKIIYLQHFIAAAESRTFLDAAETIGSSQSVISKSVQSLEKELGVKLFDRTNRTAELTPAGESLLEDAKLLCKDYKFLLDNVEGFKNSVEGKIKIATLPIISLYGIDEKLIKFTKNNKNVNVQIDEMEDSRIIEELNDCYYDIIIARDNLLNNNDQKVETYLIKKDSLVLVSSNDYKYKNYKEVSIHELQNEKFIMLPAHIKISDTIRKACDKFNIKLNIERRARLENIIGTIRYSNFVSLVMKESLKAFNLKNIKIVPLKEQICSNVILIVPKNKKRTKAIEVLISNLVNI